MKNSVLFFLTVLTFQASVSQSVLTDDMKETEEQLRASTKQINQFFRRFNGEEDENGNRYFPTDKKYRDIAMRKKYLPMLFDTQTGLIDPALAKGFAAQAVSKDSPLFLDFHNDDWFAEVNVTFNYKGKPISGLLYMRLQAQGQGYEWIIDDVAFDQFSKWFDKDTTETKKFMHPMSHELDFMTLRKAFAGNTHAEQFTARTYSPDLLTLFIYEVNQGNLTFETVNSVGFHFFSFKGYYFALNNFNRPGYNSGWLISNLVKLADDNQKQQLKNYLYNKD